MFKYLKRLQLKRKGLSCGKVRRKKSENEFAEKLRESSLVKAVLLGGFVAGLAALMLTASESAVERAGDYNASYYTTIPLALIVFLAALVQFFVNHPRNFQRNSRVLLIFGVLLVHLALLRIVSSLSLLEDFGYFEMLILPNAFAPIVLTVLLGRNFGVYATVFASLWGGLMYSGTAPLNFVVMSLVVGFVSVFVTDQVRKRGQFVRAGVYVGLVTLVLAVVADQRVVVPINEGTAETWKLFGTQVLAALAMGIGLTTLISGLIPIFESIFKLTTDISWIELADLNHPLLKKMTIEAPGTYHHSLVVANLAEAAAEAIGASATMCRVCSYFHDIGKLVKPGYFIENIGEGDNPHDDLTPTMSALVILSHVKEGVDIALKNKLNSRIIDVIEQHHGTSLAYFFYRRALDQQEEIRREVEEGNMNEEDIPEVTEKGFRYPGPKPNFRESGIISLADAVESASRSLEKPTPQKIQQLIEEIANSRIRDGQLDDCDLTLQELSAIKASFYATLRSMLHNRISYPKEDSEGKRNGERTRTERLDGKGRRKRGKGGKSAQETRVLTP